MEAVTGRKSIYSGVVIRLNGFSIRNSNEDGRHTSKGAIAIDTAVYPVAKMELSRTASRMDDAANSDSSLKEVKRSRPPLKLCFRQKVDIGRSNIVPFRPRAYVHYVTRKFYAPYYSTKCSEESYQKVKQEYENDPRKKYGYPVLESHRYGWYWDVKFHDPDSIKDKRLNFPKTKPPFYFQPISKPIL